MRRNRVSTLYRCFDESGYLLYVGVTIALRRRLYEHSIHKEWFASVTCVTSEPITDRAQALIAESTAIKTEYPRYNIRHSEVVA